MAQTNYTPISLYYSTTASAVPTAANLVQGELAINTNDGKLYYEDSSGVVQVLATKSTGSIGGSNTQVQFNNSGSLGGSSGLTWDGSFLTTSSIKNSALTSGRVTYAGASGLLSDSANLTWDNANARLGIAQGAPTQRLDVNGNVIIPLNNSYYLYTTDYGVGTGSGLEIFTGTADSIRFIRNGKAGTETMRITGTGLVGIGTSSPVEALTVNGAIAVTGGITGHGANRTTLSQEGVNGAYWQSYGANTSTYGTFRLRQASSDFSLSRTAVEIDSSGNLGLGVTPSAWDSSFSVFQVRNGSVASTNGEIGVAFNKRYASGDKYIANGYASQYIQTNGAHSWFIAPSGTAGNAISFTQAMTLDASGNLLVGTTSGSGNRLDVVGGGVQVTASGTSYNLLNLKDSVDQSGATYVQFLNSTGGGIGSISRVTTTNAVVYNTTSDYRLKTVTGAVTGQGERIDALKPIDYEWKEGNQQARGFLAHEFQTVYPNSVSGEKDAIDANGKPVYQGMQASTAEVIADLVAEIQSLRQRITTLENK